MMNMAVTQPFGAIMGGPNVLIGSATLPNEFSGTTVVHQISAEMPGRAALCTRNSATTPLCIVSRIPLPSAQGRAAAESRFFKQSEWLKNRKHPNLIPILDVAALDGNAFFMTELVQGRRIARLCEKFPDGNMGQLPEIALTIAASVASALEEIRGQEWNNTGVPTSSADLACSTVFLGADGNVRLLHLGSSLVPDVATLLRRPPAARSLVPPEILLGQQSGSEGDIYALSALMWWLLTGKPLVTKNGADHLQALRSGNWDPVSLSTAANLERYIPSKLDHLLRAGLSLDPRERPNDLPAFRRTLTGLARQTSGSVIDSIKLETLVERLFSDELVGEKDDFDRLAENVRSQIPAPRRRTQSVPAGPEWLTPREDEAERNEPNLGSVIEGTRYRLMAKLGEGGLGSVYLAEHVDLAKRVALKILHSELLRNFTMQRQFRVEARSAARIDSPHVCDVTDWGEMPDGRVFYVMEYVTGVTLAMALRKVRQMPVSRAIPIVRQLAKALAAAHAQGILHQDVKPDNVLITHRNGHDDFVKVVDIGVADMARGKGGGQPALGTPEYMAPERVSAGAIGPHSDVYALGVVAYELFTGQVPFRGKNPSEILARHLTDAPDKSRLSNIPTALSDWVLRCLEKEPTRRPTTMIEAEALLCEAQAASGVKTDWDEFLSLPPLYDPIRKRRLERAFARKMNPRARGLLVIAGVASVTTALLLLLIR